MHLLQTLDAVKLLSRALELNPKFDPIQAPIAENTLAGLRGAQ